MSTLFPPITCDVASRYIATARLTPNAVALRLRELLTPQPPMTGKMIRRCGHCKTILGTKPCIQEMDGMYTDGICDECAEKHFGVKKASEVEPAAAGLAIRGNREGNPAAATTLEGDATTDEKPTSLPSEGVRKYADVSSTVNSATVRRDEQPESPALG